MMSDKQHLEALEVKIAFLEDALNKLGDEYYQQQLTINKLQAQQQRLIQKIRNLHLVDSTIDVGDDKPPHY